MTRSEYFSQKGASISARNNISEELSVSKATSPEYIIAVEKRLERRARQSGFIYFKGFPYTSYSLMPGFFFEK